MATVTARTRADTSPGQRLRIGQLPSVFRPRTAVHHPSGLGLVARGIPADRLLAVQRAIGNRAFARAVQRLPAAGDAPAACTPPLEHSRFASITRLQAAARNKPPLSQQESGEPVKALQQALHDLGAPYLLPKTMKKGAPDGIWADETRTVLRKFQEDNGIPPGGHEAGLRTLTKLDCIYRAKEPPKKDDKLEPGKVPDQMTAVTTKPGVTDSKGNVNQRPEGKVSVDSTKPIPTEEEKEPPFKGQLGIGGSLLLATTKKGGSDDGGLSFCDHSHLEVSGQVNYTQIPLLNHKIPQLNNRVAILAEPTLSLDLAPLFCAKRPSIELQLAVVKAMIFEKVEIALLAGVGAKDPLGQSKEWLAGGGIMVEIPLGKFRGAPVKAEFGIQGELPIVQERNPDGTFKENAEVHFVTGLVLF